MFDVINRDDKQNARDEKIKDRDEARLNRNRRKSIENHQEAGACEQFYDRILPRNLAFAILT